MCQNPYLSYRVAEGVGHDRQELGYPARHLTSAYNRGRAAGQADCLELPGDDAGNAADVQDIGAGGTVNLRDFANVRPRHVAALATVP